MTEAMTKALTGPMTALALLLLTAAPAAGLAQSTAEPPAGSGGASCDRACLLDIADRYVDALLAKDWSDLPWAERVRHTENDVALMIGEGLWGTATKVDEDPFTLADPTTGNVLWLGIVEEHGDAAYFGLRLKIVDSRIAEVESVLAREGTPAHFAPTDGYGVDSVFGETLPPAERRPRARMIALAEGYYDTMQLNDGALLGEFSPDCTRVSNGVTTTEGDYLGGNVSVEGCRALFEIGYYKPVDRVRARRYPIVDEERGIVVAFAMLDHAARYVDYRTLDGQDLKIPVEYPNSHRVVELFKLRDGAVERVEGIAVFQPYLMPSLWSD
ncbi:MAG: hypothetical protein JXB36_20350 [Gammaproteobacteria bacterium]|nr:hypothetical protein [Gammaproteobacteria bacterium]